MTRHLRALAFIGLIAAGSIRAVGLPDTGQDLCYDNTNPDAVAASSAASIARDAGTHPRQDCRYGRDPAAASGALTKTGAGAKGFDYTKIANNGSPLPADAVLGTAATDWACSRDNVTGLTWEVKTAASATSLRHFAHVYSWYDTDATRNASQPGLANGGTCAGGTGCDTEKFVADVNAAALCSYQDWRLPSRRELLTLIFADGSSPSVAVPYFPNLELSVYWTSTTFIPIPTHAHTVVASYGASANLAKSAASYVMLVRGTRF